MQKMFNLFKSLVIQDESAAENEPVVQEELDLVVPDEPTIDMPTLPDIEMASDNNENQDLPIAQSQQIIKDVQPDPEVEDDDDADSWTLAGPLHPWRKMYDLQYTKKPANRRREMYSKVTLEHVQRFRDESKNIWVNDSKTHNQVKFPKAEIRTSDEIPDRPFAFYSVISIQGNMAILTPVFNEVVAHDRLDLRLVHMNKNAQDTMNMGKFNAQEYPIGDVVCVTKLQKRQNIEGVRIEKWNPEDVLNPDGKNFWEVAEYHSAPRRIRKNVTLSPFVKQGSKYLCVASDVTKVVEMSTTPTRTVDELLTADIFLPAIKPGQFLASLKNDNWLIAAKRVPKLITPNSYSPLVLSAEPADPSVTTVFKYYGQAFKHWDRENAYRALEFAVDYGSNGLLTIKNIEVDNHPYISAISNYYIRPPYMHFTFTIAGASSPPSELKWNRTAAAVKITCEQTSQMFYADVLGAQKNRLELDIKARTPLTSMDLVAFKEIKDKKIVVIQREDTVSSDINYDIEEGCNADKLIQALYGGAPLPEVTLPSSAEKILTVGSLRLLETQTRYAHMVSDENTTAMIGSSSFGCGKTAAIAAAALHSLQKNPGQFQMVTAITNSAVVALIEKLVQLDPQVRIVRIISAANTTHLPSTQLSQFDYPTLLSSICKSLVMSEDAKRKTCFGGTEPDEVLKGMMFYLKKRSMLTEESLTSQEMKNLYQSARWCNDEELLKCYMEMEKPTIIVGTVQSVLNAFSSSWVSYIEDVATIQIDEASTLPRETLLQMVTLFPNARYSLVGDYRQLSPYYATGSTPLLIETAIGDTLRQCVTNNLLPSVFLNGVFRCRPEVTELLGNLFYDSSLQSLHKKAITEDQMKKSPALTLQKSNQYPIVLINTIGTRYSFSGTSLVNLEESKAAMNLAKHLLKFVASESIAILCFYRAQMNVMRDFGENSGVYVGSVDSAQGREWPICIVCTTRTGSFANSEFLTSENRINVALSRSKHMNFILGSLRSLNNGKKWREIVEKCQEEQTIVTMKEFANIINPREKTHSSSDSDGSYEFV